MNLKITLFAAVFLSICQASCFAQPPVAPDADPSSALQFDVISIHETKPAPGFSVDSIDPPHSSKFRASNYTAMILIQKAYGVTYLQVSNAPEWLHNARFEIQAEADPSVDARLAALSDKDAELAKQQMLRHLLEERFHLRVHAATDKQAAFAMVVAKTGSRLHESSPETPEPSSPAPAIEERRSPLDSELIAHGASLDLLAAHLTGQVGATVLDRTGLQGRYDFTLQIGRSDPEGDSPWPTIYTALSEQLGLRLEPIKGPVPDIVVDHVEMPTEN